MDVGDPYIHQEKVIKYIHMGLEAYLWASGEGCGQDTRVLVFLVKDIYFLTKMSK